MDKQKQEIDTKTEVLEKKISDKEVEDKNRYNAQKVEMEAYVSTEIGKIDTSHKEELSKVKK